MYKPPPSAMVYGLWQGFRDRSSGSESLSMIILKMRPHMGCSDDHMEAVMGAQAPDFPWMSLDAVGLKTELCQRPMTKPQDRDGQPQPSLNDVSGLCAQSSLGPGRAQPCRRGSDSSSQAGTRVGRRQGARSLHCRRIERDVVCRAGTAVTVLIRA